MKAKIDKVAGKHMVKLSIGHQNFHLWNASGTKEDAEYCLKMLGKAIQPYQNITEVSINENGNLSYNGIILKNNTIDNCTCTVGNHNYEAGICESCFIIPIG